MKKVTPPVEIVVSRGAADTITRGHPWVFREALGRPPKNLQAGAEVQLRHADGSALGRGLFDPQSALAVRVWTFRDEPITDRLFSSRLDHAVALRQALFRGQDTTAFRVLNGEGDRVPGFVADLYGSVVVVKADGDAAAARLEEWLPAMIRSFQPLGMQTLLVRRSHRGQPPVTETMFGPDAPAVLEVREHGVPFVVDLARGQKTGAFLDQRENRRRVGGWSKDRRVLNLFSYAGGFSLHAALGGAVHVTSVDIAAAAHGTAQESFRRAGVDPSKHAFVAADAFTFLETARKSGHRWDLVISDPPSFAPNEKSVPRALAAYRNLHRACAAVLAPGGLFCASSCSSHVPAQAFVGTLDDGALARQDLRLLELFGSPADHPSLPCWAEGRYLKFALLG